MVVRSRSLRSGLNHTELSRINSNRNTLNHSSRGRTDVSHNYWYWRTHSRKCCCFMSCAEACHEVLIDCERRSVSLAMYVIDEREVRSSCRISDVTEAFCVCLQLSVPVFFPVGRPIYNEQFLVCEHCCYHAEALVYGCIKTLDYCWNYILSHTELWKATYRFNIP